MNLLRSAWCSYSHRVSLQAVSTAPPIVCLHRSFSSQGLTDFFDKAGDSKVGTDADARALLNRILYLRAHVFH